MKNREFSTKMIDCFGEKKHKVENMRKNATRGKETFPNKVSIDTPKERKTSRNLPHHLPQRGRRLTGNIYKT